MPQGISSFFCIDCLWRLQEKSVELTVLVVPFFSEFLGKKFVNMDEIC